MPLFMKSFKKSKNIVKISLVASILLCSGLLIERPVMNYINYKQLSPSCEKVLTKERCVSNYIVKRSVDASQSKDKNWKPYNPYQYGTIYWISSMLDTNLRTRIAPAPFPIIHLLYYTMAFVGSILILINLQSLLRKKYTRMIIIGFVVLVLSIFYSNYRAYINLEMAVAMNGRYLLPYMPIFGVLALASFSQLSNRLIKKIAVVIVLPVVLVSLTQGGGMITPIITHNTYWKENPFSEQLNSKAQKILAPVVLESSPFNLF